MQWSVVICVAVAGSTLCTCILATLASGDVLTPTRPLGIHYRTALGQKPGAARHVAEATHALVPPVATHATTLPAPALKASSSPRAHVRGAPQPPHPLRPPLQGHQAGFNTQRHELESANSTRDHEDFPLSTHKCWWEGTPEEEANFAALTPDSNHTVCRYTNLLIWNQQVGTCKTV